MDKKQLEKIKREAKYQAKRVWEETFKAFLDINEIMDCLESDRDRLSHGGQECLDNYWQMIYVNEDKDYTWRETIEAFKEINQIMDSLESDRDRFSSASKKCLDKYWVLRDNFIANKSGDIKEFLIS
tara:strand:- start:673 stop:1053 length:381 start_codon:yes stop_codon:yes gene_type:complete